MGTCAPDGGGVVATWACDGVVGSWACDGVVGFSVCDGVVGFSGCDGEVGSWARDGGVVDFFELCDDGVRFVLFDVGFGGIFLFKVKLKSKLINL